MACTAGIKKAGDTSSLPHQASRQHIREAINGPAYTARETRKFTRKLNLEPCTTAVSSPQRNGMAERFVKTIKERLYRVHPVIPAPAKTPPTVAKLDGLRYLPDVYSLSHVTIPFPAHPVYSAEYKMGLRACKLSE